MRRGELKPGLLEGAVLFGPPGTGKTTLAKALAAAAGVPYRETSVGQWFSQSPGHLDGVIKQVDAFCDALLLGARSAGAGTAVGFVDELDALPNRATMDNRAKDWWLPVITHVLMRFEALRRSGIVLVAATNHLDGVDAALLRPGRFDRQFYVPAPDEAGRLGILRIHLGTDLTGADLTTAARLSAGQTGAVLAGHVRAARRKALTAERAMTLDDLLAEVAPPDPRPAAVVRAVARHEAAHAVAALRLGIGVTAVSIRPEGMTGGATSVRIDDQFPDRGCLERQVVGLLAERAADALLGAGPNAGAASDLAMATRLLAAVHGSFGLGAAGLAARVPHEAAEVLVREDVIIADLVEADLARLMAASEALVAANRRAILAVAEALVGRRVLTGEEVGAIIAGHPARVRVRAGRGTGGEDTGRAGKNGDVEPRAPASAPRPVLALVGGR